MKTDRNPQLVHTLDTLDIDIALATLPMDFNIYDIPGGVFRRAKRSFLKTKVRSKSGPPPCANALASWIIPAQLFSRLFVVQKKTLTISRNCWSRYINKNLTETDHQHPTEETGGSRSRTRKKSWENEIKEKSTAEQKAIAEQPEIANMGNGVFH